MEEVSKWMDESGFSEYKEKLEMKVMMIWRQLVKLMQMTLRTSEYPKKDM